MHIKYEIHYNNIHLLVYSYLNAYTNFSIHLYTKNSFKCKFYVYNSSKITPIVCVDLRLYMVLIDQMVYIFGVGMDRAQLCVRPQPHQQTAHKHNVFSLPYIIQFCLVFKLLMAYSQKTKKNLHACDFYNKTHNMELLLHPNSILKSFICQ